MLLAPYVCFHIFSQVKVTEWPPIGKIAAHSAYDMFHGYGYKCLIFDEAYKICKLVENL